MTRETNDNKRIWLRPLIIGVIIIVIFVLTLGYGFKFYNSWFKYGQKAEAEEKTIVEETIVEEKAEPETATIEEEEAAEVVEEISTAVPEGVIPEPYESEGGIPYSGSEWTCDVAPDEIECLSVGPGESAGVEFKGGANPDESGIFIFLPGEEVIRYKVSKLFEGSNWHGAYDYDRIPTDEDWKLLVEDRVQAMMEPPNGTSGKGCQIVKVAVISGDQVIYQKTFEKQ
jgi:hypothetical protein